MSSDVIEPLDDDERPSPPASVGPAGGADVFSLVVNESASGQRLDAFLAAAIKTISRARIRRAIDEGLATVDGRGEKASYRVAAGERIEVQVAAAVEAPQPEPIPLDVLY